VPKSSGASPSRKLRADGERNRSRLIEAAKRGFAAQGGAVSLEQIARDAEVGIGTLYRHFPTRDALIETVYRQETDALLEAAARLSRDLAPLAALRAWMLLFVDYLATKQGMAEALKTLIGGTDALYGDSSARITDAIGKLVQAAVAAGAITINIEPLDLLRAIAGVANMSPNKDWRTAAVKMVDVLLNGLRKED
jgi:AcrR family transcriptional regulator